MKRFQPMLKTHQRRTAAYCLSLTLLMLFSAAIGQAAEGKLGGLTCDRIKGTGINILIHSSADVRCTFTDDAKTEQWYMGETGVALGLDLK
jgi:uncharacterized protein DUF992